MTRDETREPVDISSMDAFDLRHEIMAGLTLSDGLRVEVIGENALIVIGTDSRPHPRHGIYMATGRLLLLARIRRTAGTDPIYRWSVDTSAVYGDSKTVRSFGTLADLDDDLAWVQRRTGP